MQNQIHALLACELHELLHASNMVEVTVREGTDLDSTQIQAQCIGVKGRPLFREAEVEEHTPRGISTGRRHH